MRKSIRTSYNFYLDIAKREAIDERTYYRLTGEFNKFLMSKVFEGEKVTLPSGLGTLQIRGRKPKIRFDEEGNVIGMAPDWKRTRELWEKDPKAKEEGRKVYHTNDHTDGYRYRFFWSRKNVAVKNKSLYALRMSRANKRAVRKYIDKGVQFVTKN